MHAIRGYGLLLPIDTPCTPPNLHSDRRFWINTVFECTVILQAVCEPAKNGADIVAIARRNLGGFNE
jgi:hypothetical protein